MPSGDGPLANPPVTSTAKTPKGADVKFPFKCRAAVLTAFKAPLEVRDITLDEPKRGWNGGYWLEVSPADSDLALIYLDSTGPGC